MFSQEVLTGCHNLLAAYVKPGVGDHLLIVYTPDCRNYAALLSLLAQQEGLKAACMPMNPLRDSGIGMRFNNSLHNCFQTLGHKKLCIITLERDTMSHQDVIQSVLKRYNAEQVRLIRAISVCDAFFATAMKASPDELTIRNSKILSYCWGKTDIHVTTPSGTELDIAFDNEQYSWINNRGIAKPGGITILPAGEVATFPAQINGRLVADFAYNVNAINSLDSRLDQSPVTIDIVNGMAVDFKCSSKTISDFIEKCFSKHNAKYVGEVGFGTNFMVTEPIFLNSHVNERAPGIHIGFGQHNQTGHLPGYHCEIHLDLICRGAILTSDRGTLDLSALSNDGEASFFDTQDQDVFSPVFDDLDVGDCCGILNENGFKPLVIA